jgi:hypothetical protein
MKALSRLLLSIATAGGAIAVLSAPAHAVLQFSIGSGESSFGCVDNFSCDSDSATGVISIRSVSNPEFGISATGVKLTSTGGTGAPAALDATIGSFSNSSDGALFGEFALGDTNFSSVKQFRISVSATWTNATADSELDVSWFADPLNEQGGGTPFDAPGSQFDSTELDSPESGNGTVTFSDTVALNISGPFSLTLQGDLALAGGGTVSATESVTAIPEASTWTMLIAGFAGLGIAGYRVSRKHNALAV